MAVLDELKNMPDMADFANAVEQVVLLKDEDITDEVANVIIENISTTFKQNEQLQIKTAIKSYRDQEMTRAEVTAMYNSLPASFNDIINVIDEDVNLTAPKRKIIEAICNYIVKLIGDAVTVYTSGDTTVAFELMRDGAKIPVYSHPTDAGADIYCPEDVTIPARAQGVIIPCGFKMGMKEGWVAYILPRSSTGVKTPLRLSNSMGVIDSEYRGEVGLIFDNKSAKPYEIHAGDRIAQMIIMPCYHFAGLQVDDISTVEGDREGGYGSTGE